MELEIVAVYRTCDYCAETNPLEHFLRYGATHGRMYVKDCQLICAACRGREYDARRRAVLPTLPSAAPRMLGRYLDLPLDDWAERSTIDVIRLAWVQMRDRVG
jgi:hypothetical protein